MLARRILSPLRLPVPPRPRDAHSYPPYSPPIATTGVLGLSVVIWTSRRFRESLGLDQACMAKAAGDAVSHDNMFSTILGMADVATTARDPALDLAGACRKAGG